MRKAKAAVVLALAGLGLVIVAACLLPLSLWFAWGVGAGWLAAGFGCLLAIDDYYDLQGVDHGRGETGPVLPDAGRDAGAGAEGAGIGAGRAGFGRDRGGYGGDRAGRGGPGGFGEAGAGSAAVAVGVAASARPGRADGPAARGGAR